MSYSRIVADSVLDKDVLSYVPLLSASLTMRPEDMLHLSSLSFITSVILLGPVAIGAEKGLIALGLFSSSEPTKQHHSRAFLDIDGVNGAGWFSGTY